MMRSMILRVCTILVLILFSLEKAVSMEQKQIDNDDKTIHFTFAIDLGFYEAYDVEKNAQITRYDYGNKSYMELLSDTNILCSDAKWLDEFGIAIYKDYEQSIEEILRVFVKGDFTQISEALSYKSLEYDMSTIFIVGLNNGSIKIFARCFWAGLPKNINEEIKLSFFENIQKINDITMNALSYNDNFSTLNETFSKDIYNDIDIKKDEKFNDEEIKKILNFMTAKIEDTSSICNRLNDELRIPKKKCQESYKDLLEKRKNDVSLIYNKTLQNKISEELIEELKEILNQFASINSKAKIDSTIVSELYDYRKNIVEQISENYDPTNSNKFTEEYNRINPNELIEKYNPNSKLNDTVLDKKKNDIINEYKLAFEGHKMINDAKSFLKQYESLRQSHVKPAYNSIYTTLSAVNHLCFTTLHKYHNTRYVKDIQIFLFAWLHIVKMI